MLREELQHLQEQCSYVGEVVKPMDKKKVLVKVHPEGEIKGLQKNMICLISGAKADPPGSETFYLSGSGSVKT